MQYERNKNVSLILAPIPIKYLPEGTTFLRSLISPSIKEGNCSDAWKVFAHHCSNGSYQIQGTDVDHSYSPMAHAEYIRINISITDMNILTDKISDISNEFQNTNVSIHEIVCVSPPPYYIDWFDIYQPSVPLN